MLQQLRVVRGGGGGARGPDRGRRAQHRGRRRRRGLRRLRRQLPGRGRARAGARRRARSASTSARCSGGKEVGAVIGRPRRPRPGRLRRLRRRSSIIVKNLLYVSAPNEALIFSGRVRQVGDREVGYRVVRGGRALRVPALRARRPHGPHQHRHRHRGARRLLQGRHPAQRARRRQHQAARRGAAAQQRHRALPRPHAPGDHARSPRRRWRATCAACSPSSRPSR